MDCNCLVYTGDMNENCPKCGRSAEDIWLQTCNAYTDEDI